MYPYIQLYSNYSRDQCSDFKEARRDRVLPFVFKTTKRLTTNIFKGTLQNA